MKMLRRHLKSNWYFIDPSYTCQKDIIRIFFRNHINRLATIQKIFIINVLWRDGFITMFSSSSNLQPTKGVLRDCITRVCPICRCAKCALLLANNHWLIIPFHRSKSILFSTLNSCSFQKEHFCPVMMMLLIKLSFVQSKAYNALAKAYFHLTIFRPAV